MTARRRYEITDSEWERLKKRFPERLFATILKEPGEAAGLQGMSMDSTSVDAHLHGAGAKKGR